MIANDFNAIRAAKERIERPPLHIAISPADLLAAFRAALSESNDSDDVAFITKRIREWHLAIAKALALADLRAAELAQ